jgi:UDP:flavonoid glycosyltransferase YjiC (YdhE family)
MIDNHIEGGTTVMKILIPLFSPSAGTWGSLTRVLAIAEAAVKRNHEIAFCASGALKERLENLNYKVFASPQPTMFGLPRFLSHCIEKHSQNMSIPVKSGMEVGNIWFVFFISGMTKYAYLQRLVESELAAVESFAPDMLFTEMDPGAFLVSGITNRPLACTYASVMQKGKDTFPYAKMLKSVNKVLKGYSQSQLEELDFFDRKGVMKIIPSIPELEDIAEDTKDYVFTGALLHSFQTIKDNEYRLELGKRYIFVYLGTGSIPLKTIKKVLPLIYPDDSSIQFLVAAMIKEKEIRMGNVVIRPYYNAGKVIPRSDWVICHGGQNTLMQSMKNGVPVIVFPGAIFERRYNAKKIVDNKTGVMGEVADFNTEWLRDKIQKKSEYTEFVQRLQREMMKFGGAEYAIQMMEKNLEAISPCQN